MKNVSFRRFIIILARGYELFFRITISLFVIMLVGCSGLEPTPEEQALRKQQVNQTLKLVAPLFKQVVKGVQRYYQEHQEWPQNSETLVSNIDVSNDISLDKLMVKQVQVSKLAIDLFVSSNKKEFEIPNELKSYRLVLYLDDIKRPQVSDIFPMIPLLENSIQKAKLKQQDTRKHAEIEEKLRLEDRKKLELEMRSRLFK